MGDAAHANKWGNQSPQPKVLFLKQDAIWATQNGGLKVHIEHIAARAMGGTTQATIIEDSKSAAKGIAARAMGDAPQAKQLWE